jgi:type IV pilus assembly protein PilC
MHIFIYHGWNAQGERVSAAIEAPFAWLAKYELLCQGIWVKRLRKSVIKPAPIGAAELLFITEQLAILCNAHLPIVACLQTLVKQLPPRLATLFVQIIHMIEQGKTLSSALSHYAYLFPKLFLQLIAVGESSGQLPTVLAQLAQYQQKKLLHQKQMKKALLYPVSVLIISMVIIVGLLLGIVPQFQALFKDMHEHLPLMTQLVFQASDFLRHISIIQLLFIASGLMTLYYGLHQYCDYLPVLGPIIRMHQQMCYLHSLGSALQAGLKSLELAAETMLPALPDAIASGKSLQQALAETRQFPPFVIQLISIGEQTGQLSPLILESVTILSGRLEKQMEYITQLLQPILITLLGVILGGLMIALYLPIFQLGALY